MLNRIGKRETVMTATVSFIRFTCEETEDSGSDEIYLSYNGEGIWFGTGLDEGEYRDINRTRQVNGEGAVVMLESDYPDSDDYLGRVVVRESDKGQGTKTGIFNLDDAHYTLYYEVS
ncbi:hypothetical protein [Streptomyces sp. NPDC018031]|uniref:hypothetical protein n=1 Tax=Streptomyces sp. NPDC018031 TaxID=3365033 RepID=UPI0037A7704C